jgi:CheY-like chemotaxis protein
VAHEIKNPLVAIRTFAELLTERYDDEEFREDFSKVVIREIARIDDLVGRLRGLAATTPPQTGRVDIREPIRETLALLRAQLEQSHMTAHCDFEHPSPFVAVDEAQLKQLFLNLLLNSIEAMGDGGAINVRVSGKDLHGSSWIVVRVSDTGPGIPESVRTHIFDPFFTTKPTGQGTGLGLSVVHGIVRGHGGTINAYSEPEKGTVFHVYFPAVAAAVESTPAGQRAIQRQRTEHVLYVDDEEALVLLATRLLDRLGYKVTGHTDPQAALKEFRSHPQDFDVVVTDLAMPQMSGLELARELRATRPDVPIVMTSGYVRQADQELAQTMAIPDLILKPHTVDELGRRLDRLFQAQSNSRGTL